MPRINRSSSTASTIAYFKRMIQIPQMDFEFALWQMLYLVISPRRVYRNIFYHKQTKNQWARDDPAFVVLLLLFIAVTAVAYGIAYKLGVFGTLNLILFMGFIDFLLVGAIVASVIWFFSNNFLIQQQIHSADQAVEWAYCFDVHCNAFFPVFLITYVLQFFFIPIVTQNGWISLFVGNTLYLMAICYYFYVTHLGYNVLPFLRHPEVFLFPISILGVLYVVSLLLWFNVSKRVLNAYFG
ncbi:protein unc-50 [Obelidium mucronatum]|nr:protein unc-50 [Obelidium mucronatum]